jgi:hypothetical protein
MMDSLNDRKIKQAMRAGKIARLRELVAEGLSSGSEPIAVDEFAKIKRMGRAKLADRSVRRS